MVFILKLGQTQKELKAEGYFLNMPWLNSKFILGAVPLGSTICVFHRTLWWSIYKCICINIDRSFDF